MSSTMARATAVYRSVAATVAPTTAVVLLYDAAIDAILRAVQALRRKDHEAAFAQVNRASTVLRGLRQALDMDASREIAATLRDMYTRNVLALHISFGKPDAVERYGKLAEGLIELRDAWATLTPLGPRRARSAGLQPALAAQPEEP